MSDQGISSNLHILIEIGNSIYSQGSIQFFQYMNKMNDKPSGEFVIEDSSNDFLKLKSGDFGNIIFTATSDDPSSKLSIINFVITSIQKEKVVSTNNIYRISWYAGNKNMILTTTKAFTGNSIDALENILTTSDVENINAFPSGVTKSTDVMTWRCIQENMWQQLGTIVEKSFLKNDYIFWCFDDVNNNYKISSLETEKSYVDRYVVIESSDSITTTEFGKIFLNSTNFTIWKYDLSHQSNDIGQYRDKLFPNVSFLGIRDTNILSVSIGSNTFSDLLLQIGDDRQKDILEYTGLTDPNDSFSSVKVRRHWVNNTHSNYSFADLYRDYKISTYCKKIDVVIYNNIGPPIGSKVSLIKLGDTYKISGFSINEEYSDSYILQEKFISYDTISRVTNKGPIPKNAHIITTLRLVSDNFNKTGTEHIKNIIKKLESL